MPSGHAWHDGARPGMRVVSLNGSAARTVDDFQPVTQLELLFARNAVLEAGIHGGAKTRHWARFSLWVTGALFALLGAAVLVRRPDLSAGRWFGLFTGLTAVALSVSPAAGGPHPVWALVVQFLSLLTLAACLPAFATRFVGDTRRPRLALVLFWLAGGALWGGYLASVLIAPRLYSVVRPGLILYLVTGILTALFVIGRAAIGHRSQRSVRDARIALTGIACGTLPFACLTLIPQAAVHRSIVPAYITAILWSIIPLTFAYAIFRHQTLGIRRLVHRGMVYATTALVLFVTVLLLVVSAESLAAGFMRARPALAAAIILAIGALLFNSLRSRVRRLIDRCFYPEMIDAKMLLSGMRYDLLGSRRTEEVASAVVNRLRDSLHLEAISLLLGASIETMRVAAGAGRRADETIGFARPRLEGLAYGDDGLSELRFNSDLLLIARLEAGGGTFGMLVLGPRERGEVFLREDRVLIATLIPIFALAIRETTLLTELCRVSEQLTSAQEAERARIARDLHDGPLQKAILLGGAAHPALRDRDGVARELASELRELCARLRPAILDDLGLVSALEWLLEQTANGFKVMPRLTLRGMTEDDRLAPDTELALFRVTQEAVSNALKHGHATSIHVSLTRTIDGIQLSVADDGTGLVLTGAPSRGFGIPGMRERLRQVGGIVDLCPNGSSGTLVTARVPTLAPGVQ